MKGLQTTNRDYHAAFYIRLSKEDGDKLESNSVSNQRELLTRFLQTKPEIRLDSERVDDGFSGVNFDRPAVKELLADIKTGRINCVIVKDLSRFGRNYIETGRYLEQVFPFMGVRFIAVNDGYDSAAQQSQADSMILPFRNLMNDSYSRDLSIKVRSQIQMRYRRGDYLGAFPVYGYLRADTDKHKLQIDPFAADTIRTIFSWKIEGRSNQKIADALNANGVLSPLEYKNTIGWAFHTSFKLSPIAKWSATAVGRILNNEVYAGTMVQGRESAPNYKIKKKFRKPESDWILVKNTHAAIIPPEDFELVHRLLAADTRTAPNSESLFPFSGMIACARCGKSMIRRPVRANGKTYIYYMCRTRKNNPASCAQSQRISDKKLGEAILLLLREQISLLCQTDLLTDYRKTLPLQGEFVQKTLLMISKKQEEYAYYKALVSHLYEDYTKGLLCQSNYLQMKETYEKSRDTSLQSIAILEEECSRLTKNSLQQNQWMEADPSQQNLPCLTRKALVCLVEKIVILDQETVQVHFAFQGAFEPAFCQWGGTKHGKTEPQQ